MLPRINANHFQTLPKTLLFCLHPEEEGTLPNSLTASFAIIPKSDNNNTRIANYWPISLININSSNLNKILVSQVQKHIKRIRNQERGQDDGVSHFVGQILLYYCISYDLNSNADKTLDTLLDTWKRSNSGDISYYVLVCFCWNCLFWGMGK